MSSPVSIQTQATSLSHLESLPLNILEDIFFRACNCDLPLLSSTLLAALPPTPRLIQIIGLSILGSNDAHAQSDLLKRRFLNLKLYETLTTKLNPEDEFQFQLADGVRLCPRLLNNFVTEGQQSSTEGQQNSNEGQQNSTTAKYWKVELMRLLIDSGIDAQDQIVLEDDELHEAARNGLDQAVDDGNLDAVEFFCGGGVMIRPYCSILDTAFVEQECANEEIILELMDCVTNWSHDSYESDTIDDWIGARKDADERRRKEGAVEEEGTRVWIGEWAEMVWTKRHFLTYEEFVSFADADRSGSEFMRLN